MVHGQPFGYATPTAPFGKRGFASPGSKNKEGADVPPLPFWSMHEAVSVASRFRQSHVQQVLQVPIS
jgi:hypothetical protein